MNEHKVLIGDLQSGMVVHHQAQWQDNDRTTDPQGRQLALTAEVAAASHGIAGAVDTYAELPDPATLSANSLYIVRQDAGAPNGNGLYRAEGTPAAWVFLDSLSLQNAAEVPFDDSVANLGAATVQTALQKLKALAGSDPTVLTVSVRRGSDTDGDGSFAKPFATVQKAIDTANAHSDNIVIGAANAKPYLVELEPGDYPQSVDLNQANLKWLVIRGAQFGAVQITPGPGGFIRCDANNTGFEYLAFESLWVNAPKYSFKGGTFNADCLFQNCYLMSNGQPNDIEVESTHLGFTNTKVFAGIVATNSYLYFNEGQGQVPYTSTQSLSDDAKPGQLSDWGTGVSLVRANCGPLTLTGTAAKPQTAWLRDGATARGAMVLNANVTLDVAGFATLRGALTNAGTVTVTGALTVAGNVVNTGTFDAAKGALMLGGSFTNSGGTVTLAGGFYADGSNNGGGGSAWSGAAPASIVEALNRLAGKVAQHLGTSI